MVPFAMGVAASTPEETDEPAAGLPQKPQPAARLAELCEAERCLLAQMKAFAAAYNAQFGLAIFHPLKASMDRCRGSGYRVAARSHTSRGPVFVALRMNVKG